MPYTRFSEEITRLSYKELANKPKDWKTRKLNGACYYGDLAAVKRLVAGKADVNNEDQNGYFPLYLAISNGHLSVVQYLISQDAKIEDTYLNEAIMNGFPNIVQTLINGGAKVAEKNLETAVKYSEFDIVQTLIKAGAKVTDGIVNLSEQLISDIIAGHYHYSNNRNIAKTYRVHEVLSRKTTHEVLAEMERDKATVEQKSESEYYNNYFSKQEVLYEYTEAIKYYKEEMQDQIMGVKLTAAQQIQLKEIFSNGSEKDVYVRVNFVGHTTAGKTSLMLQMFRRKFNPNDIKSTNGIDILLGHCIIDLHTGVWEQYDGREADDLLQRIKEMTMTRKAETSEKEEKRYENENSAENEKKMEYIYERTTSERFHVHSQKETTIPNTETLSKPFDRLKRKKSTVIRRRIAAMFTKKTPLAEEDHLSIRIKQASSKSGRRKDKASARGFDYGGQASFYALHQLFLSRRGINIIVLDASRDFKEAIKEDDDVRHIGGEMIGNSIDFFKYWSKMLRYYLPSTGRTQIIAVFTHIDLIHDQDQLQYKIHQIQEVIREMGMSGMFYKDVFCVNANDPHDEKLDLLRKVILGLSKTFSYWGQRMPSRWLLLEDMLMTKKTEGIRVMTLAEVADLNDESSPKLNSRNELFLFLKVHHEVGTLIHFADEGLQNVIILDAQWLVDSFKTIISAKQFRDPKYQRQWNRLHEKGVVDKDFIYHVWEHNQQERFFEFREELVFLMNSMDLICSPRKYNKEGQHVISPYLMVPCMLHKAPVGFVEEYRRTATQINHPLVFEFDLDFLPSATVYRLLATCIMQYGDTDHLKALVFCDAAVFKVFESHFLTLEITNSSIIANVLFNGENHANVGISQGVREFLEDSLRCITTAQRTTAKYKLSVARDKDKKPSSCLEWSKLLEESMLPKENNDSDSKTYEDIRSILEEWVVVKEPEKQTHKYNERNFNQSIVLDYKPTPYFLGRISRRISPKSFQELFLGLGLEQHVIDEKECQSPKSYKKVMLLLFIEWAKNSNSTIKMLANALFKHSQYVLNIEEIHVVSNEWRNDIPSKMLTGTLLKATDAELDKICTITGGKYLELGLELGLEVEQMEIFEVDLKYCQIITRKVLETWINEQRFNATLVVLGDALHEIGCDVQFILAAITKG